MMVSIIPASRKLLLSFSASVRSKGMVSLLAKMDHPDPPKIDYFVTPNDAKPLVILSLADSVTLGEPPKSDADLAPDFCFERMM